MRVVSDFHDYYDSVQVYGSDPSLVYIQRQEEISLDPQGTPPVKRKGRCFCLKDRTSQGIRNPFSVHQEIATYLGNRLAVQRDPEPVITDNLLRYKKGFDEWSFRRHREEDPKCRKRHTSGYRFT